MPLDVARIELYRAVINLWVEDSLTREYLSAVWQNDPDVAFFVGGGNDGVRAVVHDAETAGYTNVFGVTDRDFRPTNRSSWFDPGKTFRTFILPVHEIENYLLDAEALHASRLHNLGLVVDDIERHLSEAAGRLCWWAACREVVAELKRRFREPFVSDPPCSLSSIAEAECHICQSKWFQKLDGEAANTNAASIRQLLTEGHQLANRRLGDGTWRQEFAGKEILRDVGSRLCDRRRLPFVMAPAEFDVNLAKDVAEWQVQESRVPPDLQDLLKAIKRRLEGA